MRPPSGVAVQHGKGVVGRLSLGDRAVERVGRVARGLAQVPAHGVETCVLIGAIAGADDPADLEAFGIDQQRGWSSPTEVVLRYV